MVMSLENSMISRSRARSTLSPHQSQQPQTGTSPEHAGALGGNQAGRAVSTQAPCFAARILALVRPGLTRPPRPDLQSIAETTGNPNLRQGKIKTPAGRLPRILSDIPRSPMGSWLFSASQVLTSRRFGDAP